MEWNPLKWPITCLSGVLLIIFYCIFTLISYILYPGPYSPATNYLSRLGDWKYSPTGALFYNAGCILTGLALFAFYIGLYEWYTDEKWRRIFLSISQVIGLCSAIALVMIGVFSEDTGRLHMLWSATFFALNFMALIMVNTALITHPKFMKLVGLYGFSVTLFSLVLTLFLEPAIGGAIIEWFTVFSSLGFAALLVFNMLKVAFPARSKR